MYVPVHTLRYLLQSNHMLLQFIMTLVYLLLYRYMQIVELAHKQVIPLAQIDDMCAACHAVLEVFEQRLEVLEEVWRQQRRDIENQVECYNGGIFERLYDRVSAIPRVWCFS